MALFFNYSAGNLTATGQLPGGWAGMAGSPTFGSADGPAGINTVHCDGHTAFVYMPNVAIPTNAQGLICGAGFNVTSGLASQTGLMSIGGSGVFSLLVQLSPDGSIQCFYYGQSPFSSPSGVFSFGSRHEVEVLVSSFSAGGLVTVALDGVPLVGLTSIATGFLTALADGSTIHTVAMGGNLNGGSGTSTQVVDSTYVGDTTGGHFNTLQGPCISQPMIPNANGHASAWSVSGFSDGWQALAVIPPAGDSSYIYDDTPGDQEAVELSLPANLTAVYGLTVFSDMRQDTSGGGRTVSLGVGNGSTQDYGAIYGTWGLGTTYSTYGTPFSSNPFTGVAWALSDLNTLQWAAKVAS